MKNWSMNVRFNVLLSFVLIVAIIAVGCGGGSMSTVPGAPAVIAAATAVKQLFKHTAIPHIATRVKVTETKTSSIHMSYSGVAYAQATAATVTLTGGATGYCLGQPGTNQAVPDNFEYAVYGGGQLSNSKCDSEWILDRSLYVANAKGGIPIIGNQQLKGFVIRADGGSGLGFTGFITIRRGSTVLNTGFTCTAPAGSLECEDGTTTFDVLDHDKVFISITGHKGDTYDNIQWAMGAQ
jgi:hypothetical protein